MEGNLLTATAELAMHVTLAYVRPGDFVIDATCGAGNDTLALAKAVGPSGRVLAVDLQEQALRKTRTLLAEEDIRHVTAVQGSFVRLADYVKEAAEQAEPSAAVFNLGYLPGGDKTLTTKTEDTLAAAETALALIKTGGVVTLVMYPGHPEGARELQALISWAEGLSPRKYHTVYASLPNQKNSPPQVLWITKKK